MAPANLPGDTSSLESKNIHYQTRENISNSRVSENASPIAVESPGSQPGFKISKAGQHLFQIP
jgi:hypothetical protein